MFFSLLLLMFLIGLRAVLPASGHPCRVLDLLDPVLRNLEVPDTNDPLPPIR